MAGDHPMQGFIRGFLLTAGMLVLPVGQAAPEPVTFYATVTDRQGEHVTGLTASDFRLDVNGRSVAINEVSMDRAPARFVMLLEYSMSLKEQAPLVGRLARGVIEMMGPNDRMQIADIHSQSQPRPVTPSSDQGALLRLVVPAGGTSGRTNFWDRLALAVSSMERDSGYRAIVVISDGQDLLVRGRPREITRQAQRAGVVVHTLVIPEAPIPMVDGRPVNTLRTAELRDVVEDTGGLRVRAPLALGEQALAHLRAEISGRYAIRFTPASGTGDRLDLRLRAVRRDLTVRAPRGY